MGELYNPYPKLPKNIRQVGERDQVVKLYIEDYVNTYLKRLYPAGGQDLRVGLLLGEIRTEDGVPFLFIDGAIEMEQVTKEGEKVEFTEEAWKKAYQVMEQMFPHRSVQGWFLCGAPGCALSPLDYWKQHGQYFAGKNQLMYLNSGLEGDEAIYTASEDGFYKLRGYSIYYERNQMMQDYMVSRKDARRVESGTRDTVIQDFRERMEDNRQGAARARSAIGLLGGACSVMAVLVLAGGLVMFGNYRKMKDMEAVIASVMPSDGKSGAFRSFARADGSDEVEVEAVPGEVYPTLADIVISPEQGSGTESSVPAGTEGGKAGNTQTEAGAPAGGAGAESQEKAGTLHGGNAGASADALSGETERGPVVKESGNHADDPAAKEAEAGAAAQTPLQGAKTGVAAQAAASVQIPADAVKHVVQEGETLYGICMEQYHSMAQIPQICAWNGLADENHISVGQELYLPAK
ncbi:LysM domain-containing protein [Clostridium sp. AM42-4]|uniref:LysM peptidoglycan-binding domain-containing protein n=1 Tax=Clostridium sp. AM42-4 TaxID=2292305 RepID=UPI000E520139|nr:LysM domain-containing protein [Clostridium sp. AM42-4]RHS90585.1 LysM domain-containing protein [Clostridium sp. AM42-4]